MFVSGAWNVCCDRCGGEFKNTQLRREWTGLMTCHGAGTNDCFDPRHPQLDVRGKADRQAPRWVRPEPDPVFVEPGPPDWDAL